MIVQFNYILAFVSILNVQYSDSQLYGTETTSNSDLYKCAWDNKISENISNYIDEKLQDLENNIMEKLEIIIGLEYNIKKYTDVIPNILLNPSGRDVKRPEIMDTLGKKLAEIDRELQSSITVKFQILEDNRIKQMNELMNTIKFVATTTKMLTEQMENVTKTVPKITKRMVEMERYLQNNVNANFQVLGDKIEKINEQTRTTELLLTTNTKRLTNQIEFYSNTVSESILTINKKLEVIETELQNNISAKFQRLEKEIQSFNKVNNTSQVSNNNTNEFRNNTSIQTSPCTITVPESVHTNNSIWRKYVEPGKDELDEFMINRTGCNHTAFRLFQEQAHVTTLDGEVYEWRGGVRAWEDIKLKVWTDQGDGYIFLIGENHNALTKVGRWYSNEKVVRLSTPAILSAERYVWFHLTVQPGRVTLQTECDGALNITRPFVVQQGDKFKTSFTTRSETGGKLLHGCPV